MAEPRGGVRDDPDSESVVRQRCHEFATMHAEVPVYASIAAGMATDDAAVSLLRRAAAGQARPVLLLAALHDLAIQRPDEPWSAWFDSHAARRPAGEPWPAIRDAIATHRDHLAAVLAHRATQTNEVNRSTYVRAMVARACADHAEVPVTLVELGASAGFLLNLDRYRVTVGTQVAGPSGASVRCHAENEGGSVDLTLPPVVARAGLDAAPIGPDDAADLRWLRACIWPEMPERIDRFDAAVQVLREHPVELTRGDMVDALPALLERVRVPGSHLVVFSSWALTYVPRERRPAIASTLAAAAADGPVSWVTAEPPGCMPGLSPDVQIGADPLTGTVIGARRWRNGAELDPEVWGTVHPHGNSLHFV